MKVVVAMDSFKGILSSLEAGEAIKEGIRKAVPDGFLIYGFLKEKEIQ